ncbi:MAG: hypothetical protein RIQ94_151 [Pseudomonadota bacterium]|jgi:hypothetical protein
MKNSILIVNAQDIPAALLIAKDLENYQSYVFDPTLLDKAIDAGLINCEYIVWENAINYSDLHDECRHTAFEIEQKLNDCVHELVPEVSVKSWQHLNFYYILQAIRWYTQLWIEVLPSFKQDKVHVFFCDAPAQYYFASYIPALLSMQVLNKLGIEFKGYSYPKPQDWTSADANLVPDLRPVLTESSCIDVLTHIPTCFYDFNYFSQELIASGKKIVNLQAKYVDIPIAAHTSIGLSADEEMLVYLPDTVKKQVEAFFNRLVDDLDSILIPYITASAYRIRQTTHIASLYKAQLVTYHLLEARFKSDKPKKILLSDHDAGFHGPIITFAEKHSIPILMVAHAKTSQDIEFSYSGITSFNHPIQGGAILNAKGIRVNSFKLNYPEKFSTFSQIKTPIRKISLLLNGLALNGVIVTNYNDYITGIRKIIEWCEQHDIELIIRNRPGGTILNLLGKNFNLNKDDLKVKTDGPLSKFIEQDLDLCLMYGAPTSGSIEFLNRSIPLLNPITQAFCSKEEQSVNGDIVPRDTVKKILELLDLFINDETSLQDFKMKQFISYINQFKEAQHLRNFL